MTLTMPSQAQKLLPLAFVLATMCAGCATREEWDRFWDTFRKDDATQPQAQPRRESTSRALMGTIGPLVTVEGLQLTQVRGFGLVVDLAGLGGKDGPDDVKRYLQKEIRRQTEIGMPGLTPEQVFDSMDAVMVEVTGLIPAVARKGDRFDVVVRALGSQAKSLVGGRLVLCELKLYADTPAGVIEGRTLATATGPVFVSPFDREGRRTSKVDPRTGFVLGGGSVKEPRRLRLILNDPSYSTAQQIVTRLNSRFATLDPIADAKGPGEIELKLSEDQVAHKRLFLERIVHTMLNGNPALLEKRADELVEEMRLPGVEYDSIGLAWESIGRAIVVPRVRELYEDPSPEVSFFAGRTGLRLGDTGGMEAVARHARDANSRYRIQAIEELGDATTLYGAGEQLRKLLNDPDDDVRVRAYLALRKRPHPAIERSVLDRDNFILDVVDTKGPYLIYVQRLNEPLVALFGRQMRCRPPAIFPGSVQDGRRLLTRLNAATGDADLKIVYTNKRTGVQSPVLAGSLDVPKLVTFLGDTFKRDDDDKPTGLAVPYSEVVDILASFCKDESIPAKFVVEEQTAAAQAPDEDRRERPETEY